MKSKQLATLFLSLITLGTVFLTPTSYAIGETSATPIYESSVKEYKLSDLKGKTIETERLILTPTTNEDLDKLAEYLLNKDVTKYLDPTIGEDGFESKDKALDFLKSGSEEYSESIEFTINLKDSNTPIGKIDLMLANESRLSLGYWLGKEFQGKGYMSEAGYELCNKAFNASDIESLEVYCDIKNTGSLKLAYKIFTHIKNINKYMNLSVNCFKGHEEGNFNGKIISLDYYSATLRKIK